jgi:hypothetical protein
VGSFTKIEIKNLQSVLSNLLVEDLSIAEDLVVHIQGNVVTVDVSGGIFSGDCQETQKYPLTHRTIGCLFSSFLACVLAKTSGKPIIIDSETHRDTNTTAVQFLILEE